MIELLLGLVLLVVSALSNYYLLSSVSFILGMWFMIIGFDNWYSSVSPDGKYFTELSIVEIFSRHNVKRLFIDLIIGMIVIVVVVTLVVKFLGL